MKSIHGLSMIHSKTTLLSFWCLSSAVVPLLSLLRSLIFCGAPGGAPWFLSIYFVTHWPVTSGWQNKSTKTQGRDTRESMKNIRRSKQHSKAAGKQPKHEEMKRAPWDPSLRNPSCGALREDYPSYYVIRRSDLKMEDCVLRLLNFIKFTLPKWNFHSLR